MKSLSRENKAAIIEAFNSTLRLHDCGSGLRFNDGLFVKLKPVG